MAKEKTIFQRLSDVMIGTVQGASTPTIKNISRYELKPNSEVLYSFGSKEERDAKLLQLKQQKLLSYQWVKSGYDTSMEQLAGYNQVRVMYRDADLMDAWPEIGAALDIVAEETTCLNPDGQMINVYSKSKRIKSILEDLFVNRLNIHTTLPMIARSVAKYGNEFMHLNLDTSNGVTGWRELPVHEMVRVENGMQNGYSGTIPFTSLGGTTNPDETKFVWEGHNEQTPYRSWQIAHFRMIKDSIYLPYGVSYLNKARRAWRMLSMMEDAMMLYRLERSIERRIFKVNVGLIDDADVPQFLQDFMNNVKRAPIIDPQTGQIDLRKNFLDVSADYVIPVRNGQDPTSIETLQAAQNPTTMDDINYMENKILAAIRMPKSFLNFQEAQGKGQNLSIMDIRFNRAINSFQQALILELNKIAIIHLYLLGFEDELTNFTITMNNPSNQIEMMELDNLTKRIGAASSALAQQGGGIPLMSWHQVQKEIMHKTDDEISDILDEIRLETAMATELQLTNQIIKKTGMFDTVDRIYGEPGAKYNFNAMQGGPGGDMGGMGGGGGAPMLGDMGGGDFGDDLGDLGAPDAEGGDMGGAEEGAPLADMGGAPAGGAEGAPMESIHRMNGRNVLLEQYIAEYKKIINRNKEKDNSSVELLDKGFLINEQLNSTINELESKVNEPKDILK